MRVLAVSSWGGACGIAEHTRQVKEAVEAADPTINFWVPGEAVLDPDEAFRLLAAPDAREQVVWLNHHDALHSRWTSAHVLRLRSGESISRAKAKVLVTYHDTREHAHLTPKLGELIHAADHTIVHEPLDDLTEAEHQRTTYLRQGVLELPGVYELAYKWKRPYLGTCGFDFPWKNYTRLAQLTAEIGWGMLLLSNNLTQARAEELLALNPHLEYPGGFLHASDCVSRLAGCTATAFMYECANTGTSGAIRLGIAARKPLYALKTCRQFRDLFLADDEDAVNWMVDWDHLRLHLIGSMSHSLDHGMVYLAERDSMAKVGKAYARILRSL
jgi:hypothetical protein